MMDIGVSPLSNRILMGRSKKLPDGNKQWITKPAEITDAAIKAVFEYMYNCAESTGTCEVEVEGVGTMTFVRDTAKPKWTTETPTEEGLYWQHMEVGNPQICYVYPRVDRVCFLNGYVMSLTQDDDVKIWWLKAERPEPPALPEEGGSV